MSNFENEVLKRLKAIEAKLLKLVPDDVEDSTPTPSAVPAPHIASAADEKPAWIQTRQSWDIERSRRE